MVARTRLLPGVLLVVAAAGCHSGGNGADSQSSALRSPAAAASQTHGHYRGAAAIGEATYRYHAEALITADGEVRLHFGGPLSVTELQSGAGVPPAAFATADAFLFVGDVGWTAAGHGSGRGAVFGERCAASNPGRFCAGAVPAEISLLAAGSTLLGDISVPTAQGAERWLFDLDQWSSYYSLGADFFPTGQFAERLAPFAEAGAPIIVIDAVGRLFFQSPGFGCTGNGLLTPHANGRFYVFDVDLVIESCAGDHAYLNGGFEGLATEAQDNFWGYDSWLVMWLSTPEGSTARVAFTMLGGPL